MINRVGIALVYKNKHKNAGIDKIAETIIEIIIWMISPSLKANSPSIDLLCS